ncbi:hypothetical protein KSF_109630 [Reticulibacter mediterranei]|uniref:Uncharacterized protein n=1 Tax=Reticulibacter mediterranei TaxID=2778369 RepID=A0A8J3N9S6_9CHLR|nr:hypothetical protein [Reticulibacter mediterranei]GHP00916.1 hypothetical protein KSF_109630 [Reticulibacter mediterranei]
MRAAAQSVTWHGIILRVGTPRGEAGESASSRIKRKKCHWHLLAGRVKSGVRGEGRSHGVCDASISTHREW